MKLYYIIQSYLKIPIPVYLKKIFKKYYGKNQLDKQIKTYMNYKNGFYVEIGAYDGVTQSNTLYFEKNNNWKGILIEPSKEKFKKCVKYRSKKNKFFNNACVSFSFKDKKLELTYSGLKTFSKKFLSDKLQKEYRQLPEIFIGEKVHNYKILAKPMNSILIKSKAPKLMDLLSLDTEGSELEILGGINFNIFNFRYILVETNYFNKVKKFLKDKNYKFIKKFNENDYFFKLYKK